MPVGVLCTFWREELGGRGELRVAVAHPDFQSVVLGVGVGCR